MGVWWSEHRGSCACACCLSWSCCCCLGTMVMQGGGHLGDMLSRVWCTKQRERVRREEGSKIEVMGHCEHKVDLPVEFLCRWVSRMAN
jgi:hypothetical protein